MNLPANYMCFSQNSFPSCILNDNKLCQLFKKHSPLINNLHIWLSYYLIIRFHLSGKKYIFFKAHSQHTEIFFTLFNAVSPSEKNLNTFFFPFLFLLKSYKPAADSVHFNGS